MTNNVKPEGSIKQKGQSHNMRFTRKRKTKQMHNTIYVEHHYTQRKKECFTAQLAVVLINF